MLFVSIFSRPESKYFCFECALAFVDFVHLTRQYFQALMLLFELIRSFVPRINKKASHLLDQRAPLMIKLLMLSIQLGNSNAARFMRIRFWQMFATLIVVFLGQGMVFE